jgi:hypothetical protein
MGKFCQSHHTLVTVAARMLWTAPLFTMAVSMLVAENMNGPYFLSPTPNASGGAQPEWVKGFANYPNGTQYFDASVCTVHLPVECHRGQQSAS